jgi:hypothetical protein
MLTSVYHRIRHDFFWQSLAITAAVIVAILLTGYGAILLTADSPFGRNPDALLRLTKVQQLIENGGWKDHLLHRDNAPYGTVLQWTRVMDILILLGSLPLMLFLNPHQALYAWSFVMPTLFLLVQVWVLLKIAQKGLGLRGIGLLFLGLATSTNGFLLAQYAPLSVDHHWLLALLATGAAYYAMRLLQSGKRLQAWRLALVLALGVWVAPEFLVVAAILLGLLGLAQAWYPQRYPSVLWHSIWPVPILLLFAVFTELSDINEVRHDSLSLVHVALFALLAVPGAASYWMARCTSRTKRLLVMGSLAAGVLLAMQGLYPGFYKGPNYHVSPLMEGYFLHNVAEYQPLYAIRNWPLMAQFIGLLLPVCFFYTRQARWESAALPCLIVSIAMAGVWGLLGVLHIRLIIYAVPFLLLLSAPIVELLHAYIVERQWLSSMKLLRAALAICTFVYLPIIFSSLPFGRRFQEQDIIGKKEQKCQYQMIEIMETGHLQTILPKTTKVVLADNNVAPFLLFYTPFSSIPSNSHRNERGFMDYQIVLIGEDVAKVREVLLRRHVDVLGLCALSQDIIPKASLTNALQNGHIPSWLTPIHDPKLKHTLFFTVDRQRLAQMHTTLPFIEQ